MRKACQKGIFKNEKKKKNSFVGGRGEGWRKKKLPSVTSVLFPPPNVYRFFKLIREMEIMAGETEKSFIYGRGRRFIICFIMLINANTLVRLCGMAY